jgi:hypothetical protein
MDIERRLSCGLKSWSKQENLLTLPLQTSDKVMGTLEIKFYRPFHLACTSRNSFVPGKTQLLDKHGFKLEDVDSVHQSIRGSRRHSLLQ